MARFSTSRRHTPLIALMIAFSGVACSSPTGGGGGVATPCQTTAECSGYPCTNGFCDFSTWQPDTQTDAGNVTDTGGTATDTSGTATDSGSAAKDTGGGGADTSGPQPDTSAPVDAGCKTAQGQPCCTSAAQCPAGSACTVGGCDLKTGECTLTAKPNCCQKDSDCGAGAGNPCKKGSCDVATKTCSIVNADNGDPCDDGNACTQKDNCVVGSCNGQPLDCDDGDPCTSDSCANGTCKNTYIQGCCAKGACCDLAKKTFRPKGSQCGDKPLTELRCKPDGMAVETRFAFAVCGGTSSTCPTTPSTSAWSAWYPVKTCTGTSKCAQVGSSVDCVPQTTSTTSCTSGVCCDTTTGKIKGKGSQCSTSVYTSSTLCVGNNVFKAEQFRGCYGTSSSGCSSSSSYRYRAPAKFYQACKQGQYCYRSSSTYAYCKTGQPCTTGACCDVKGTGVQLPKYTKCGTTPAKTEYMCGEGNTILKREAFAGCSGSSATCSTSSSYYTWGSWSVDKTCPSSQSCKISNGVASCSQFVAPKQCTSGSCCDMATGRYKPRGSKCSSTPRQYQYTCAADYKSVRRRTAYYGCTGASSSCSSYSGNYHWSDWATYATCSSSTYCKQTSSSSTSKPYCSSSPYKCSSGSCCDSSKKLYTPKYTSCSSTVKSTRYKCDQSGQHVLASKATYGCAGYGSSCQTSSSYWSWSAWAEVQKCAGGQHCVQSTSSSSWKAYCQSAGN